MISLSLIVVAYLVGSIPVGILLARLKGKDPRKTGSGNIGATNVMRSAGKLFGILTLFGDILKGFVPVFITVLLKEPDAVVALVGLAAFVGHLFPIFLGFKGGKGVATGAGVFLAIGPLSVLFSFMVFAVVFLIWRYVSLGSLLGTISIVLFFVIFREPPAFIVLALLIGIGVYIKHSPNIRRLLSGTENKIGAPKT
ncbi:MAG TPA: glycerol-3-phosphate 1-O-acyltransferase PlsY [Syntrophorhabdaceae bacterium]|nr:glycerol-3-phosphate 1-O-acyltransferase PlsY [Syntrophorhabdaceae bacterium]